ncbi:Uncharacterized protein NV38_0001465 [Leptospira kirschneri serovar Mozdok]|nr:Uncharacterized protein NV38_0001465 [Leptospira kirschneri serovar Mozdok]NDK06802.1 hypothetical protein [Leptospira kirschneri serovar Mozdok]
MGRNSGEDVRKIFSIRKTYFLQVKNLILVGTLERCVFWVAFYIKTKGDSYIMFYECNLLNKAKESGLPVASRFALSPAHVN